MAKLLQSIGCSMIIMMHHKNISQKCHDYTIFVSVLGIGLLKQMKPCIPHVLLNCFT